MLWSRSGPSETSKGRDDVEMPTGAAGWPGTATMSV
jgi:hypothetical protein